MSSFLANKSIIKNISKKKMYKAALIIVSLVLMLALSANYLFKMALAVDVLNGTGGLNTTANVSAWTFVNGGTSSTWGLDTTNRFGGTAGSGRFRPQVTSSATTYTIYSYYRFTTSATQLPMSAVLSYAYRKQNTSTPTTYNASINIYKVSTNTLKQSITVDNSTGNVAWPTSIINVNLDPATINEKNTQYEIRLKITYRYSTTGTSKSTVNFDEVKLDITYDTNPPQVVSATTPTDSTVDVLFDEALDPTTANTAGNYSISGLTVSSAVLQADNKTVRLTTNTQIKDQIYIVSISNVKDMAGNTMTTAGTVTFTGIDTTPPKISSLTVLSDNSILVNYSEALDATTASEKLNYSIPGLTVNNATLQTDNISVILATTTQIHGTVYNLTVNNVKDTSNNVIIAPNNSMNFTGTDTTAPTVASASSVNDTTVRVIFSEPMDTTSVSTTANYNITDGLTVKSVTVIDNKTVDLTTSTQSNHSYTVTVTGVKDANNIVIGNLNNTAAFNGSDSIPPSLVSASAPYNNRITLVFSEPLDSTTISNTLNYNISPSLSIISAALQEDGKSVTLLTATQSAGINYTVTVTNIKDLAGLIITGPGNIANFVGSFIVPPQNPHGKYQSNSTEPCANCHNTHNGSDVYMSPKVSEYDLCMTCHDITSGQPATGFTDNYKHLFPGKTNCSGCHDPHKDPVSVSKLIWSTYNSKTKTGSPTDYSLCFDCHNSTVTTTPGRKQIALSVYNIYQYYSKTLNTGQGVYGIDKGHFIKNSGYTFSDGTVVPLGYQLRCNDCHDKHGSSNKKLLKTKVGDNPNLITLTDTSTTGLTIAEERAFCQSCHNGSTHLYNSADTQVIIWDPNKNNGHTDATIKCTDCHGGKGISSERAMHGAHAPTDGESQGGVDCILCHSNITNDSTSTKDGKFHHVADKYTFDATKYTKNQSCLQCHVDHDKFNPSVTLGNVRASNLRKMFDSATGAANPSNTDFIDNASDPGYTNKGGICLSCHNTTQTKGYDTAQSTHVLPSPSIFENSAHNYKVSTSYVNDNSSFQANCAKCHNDDIVKSNWQSPNKFGTHSSTYSSILSPFGGATLAGTEEFCYKCHSNNISSTADVYGLPMANGKNVWAEFNTANWSKHDITGATGAQMSCASCHGTHNVTKNKYSAALTDSDISNPANTLNPFTTATGDMTAFCLSCHIAMAPKATNTSTAFVPMDIIFPNTNFTTNNSGWDKSSYTSSRHYTNLNRKVQCTDCHVTHGSQYRLLLNAADDTSTVDGSCFKCHNGTGTIAPNIKGEFIKPYRHPSLDTTTGPHSDTENYNNLGTTNRHSECEDCHDPHVADNTTATAPNAPGMVKGVSGVGVGTRTAWTSLPYNSTTYTFKKAVTYEYELCYKCHSTYSWGTKPPTALSGGLETDIAQQFNPANPSYHPVEAVTKNNWTGLSENFNTTSPFRVANVGKQTMYCFDCHGDSDLQANGYTSVVKGPHGSNNKYLLKKPYDPDNAGGAPKNDFCLLCHAASVYDSTNNSGTYRMYTNFRDSSRNLHLEHRNSWYTSYFGGSGKFFCGDCHGLYVHGQTRAKLIVYQTDPAPYNTWSALINWTNPGPGNYAENSCTVGPNPRTGAKCYGGH